jgi:hypothetical protein
MPFEKLRANGAARESFAQADADGAAGKLNG